MKRLFVALISIAACNPAQRCKTVEDCSGANPFCSAGFCADGPVPEHPEPIDLDGPDAGRVDGGEKAFNVQPDGGPIWDGRDGG